MSLFSNEEFRYQIFHPIFIIEKYIIILKYDEKWQEI